MARLPIPGADDDHWGEILNEFLLVAHEPDGKPRDYVTPQMFVGDVKVTDEGWSKPINLALKSGRAVFLPPGEYPIAESVVVPSGAYFYGQGKRSLLRATKPSIVMVSVGVTGTAAQDVVVRDLALNGGGKAVSAPEAAVANVIGLCISNARNVRVEGLFVEDMGINSSTVDDRLTGGWGIQVTSQWGPAEDVIITRCFVARIAGSGNYRGDGIQVTHFHGQAEDAPKRIYISDCHVEDVGRHCFSFDGAVETPVRTVSLRSSTGRRALLCGIDLEEACDVTIEDVRLTQCGLNNAFGDPRVLYPESEYYGLRAGIAYGTESHRNTFRNLEITECPIGISCGAGCDNQFEQVFVRESLWQDIKLCAAHLGARNSLVDCKFQTPQVRLRDMYWLYGEVVAGTGEVRPSDMTVTRCTFASQVSLKTIADVAFRDCLFQDGVRFNQWSTPLDLAFEGCRFRGTGIVVEPEGFDPLGVTFTGCEFSPASGTLALGSCKEFSFEQCAFRASVELLKSSLAFTQCDFRNALGLDGTKACSFNACTFRGGVNLRTAYSNEGLTFAGCDFRSGAAVFGADACAFRDSVFQQPVRFAASGGTRNLTFSGCRFVNGGSLSFDEAGHRSDNVRIEGCEFRSWWGISAAGNAVRNVTVVGNFFYGVARALRHLGASEVGFSQISGNHFDGCTWCIHITGAARNVTVADNTFSATKGDCIAFYDVPAQQALRGCVVRANRAAGPEKCAGGIGVMVPGTSWDYCVVEDNSMNEWMNDRTKAYSLPSTGNPFGRTARNY